MAVLSEDKINRWIVPYLSSGKRGSKLKVAPAQLISGILYRLKTGCQWRELPLKEIFDTGPTISWQGVYHHFRKWSQDGSFKKVWLELLKSQRRLLDLSSVQLDGSQTICKKGGQGIGYQTRKAANSCNSLFLADNKGQMLACSPPIAGVHHDLFEIEEVFNQLCNLLKEAGIETEGLFLNADAGFDSAGFRSLCAEMKIEANIAFNPRNGKPSDDYVYFDEQLFKRRNAIERANAWLDSFKALLIRFETKALHWFMLLLMAFSVLFIRKINKNPKL
ncbi:IS5 family transposase ISMac11 [Adhaeribacter aerolatus]|uniref:IS5 family transposase ISMac11 n=1 Tax=Adhaeribacter aerolatus TaxID=670289 RepID=A0A512B6B1_9BACT|nr:transposase [Adhaeribacter aerolatus]GEO07501.1 IS5 family transposase ISMac11 [Adhaeribacter aerolatus]